MERLLISARLHQFSIRDEFLHGRQSFGHVVYVCKGVIRLRSDHIIGRRNNVVVHHPQRPTSTEKPSGTISSCAPLRSPRSTVSNHYMLCGKPSVRQVLQINNALTNFKLGYDIVLTAVGGKIEESVGKAAAVGFDTLTSSLDALDTYFSQQIYKNVNDQHDPNRKKSVESGSNIPNPPPVVIGPSNMYTSGLSGGSAGGKTSQQGNGSPSSMSANAGGYSNSSGGSAYNQLVASLSQLVAAL
jgi:hypothetical protein